MRLRLVALLFLSVPALANITSSSLTGTVTIGGKPAAGVTVTVASRTTTTNAHGRYWVNELPPGVYDVTFSLAAHTTLTRRAVLELARVARADATLEPNPDEDSTTSTAVTVNVAETIFPTTYFDDRALDRLPTGRLGSASLAPGNPFGGTIVDGVPGGAVTSEETVEQMTIVTAASPVEWQTFFGNATALRTRSGGEELFFTVRDTFTERDGHFGEATSGGRIVPERLWFFAAAWRGEQFDGELAKLDAQLGTAHHFSLSYSDTRQDFSDFSYDAGTASLRYTAAAGPRFTSEVIAARTDAPLSQDFVSGRASYILGDHVLTAGFASSESNVPDSRSLFVSDRWSFPRWNVYAGLRHDDGELSGSSDRWTPRVAVAFDVRGTGRQAIAATWGEYAVPNQPENTLRVLSLGYASAIGNSGSARADAVRRESGAFWQHELQLDARYRLFDRFEAGGTYTLSNTYDSGIPQPFFPDQQANVWLGAEVPVGSHEFGATILQRYIESPYSTAATTDVALRYAIPFSRVRLLLATDALNVFAQGDRSLTPRTVRVWIRVRAGNST